MRAVIENIDGVRQGFTSESQLVEFVQRAFDENEEDAETILKRPETLAEAVHYVNEYCGNLEFIK